MQQSGYIWNTVAGLVNAGEAVILSMITTRTDGLEAAGILSIAFAIGNLMMAVGKFGVRNYQVTDTQGKFSFSDYFWARIVTVALMAAASVAYLFFCTYQKGYSQKKVVVMLAICFIYTVESLEDVFWGFYQQRNLLDTGAKIFILRWGLILGVFILLLVTGQGLQKASVMGAFAGLVAFFFSIAFTFFPFHEKIHRARLQAIKQVCKQCFPLFAVSFMALYVTNAPKYAIDRYLPQDVQACYGFISMPVFVIEMLNGFLYQPSLVQMALEWQEGRIYDFCNRLQRQCMMLAGLTAVCLIGAYLCGIPALSLLYGTNLAAYKKELLILLLGGGMLAYAGYFCVLMTIMRKQRLIMYGYAGVTVLALFLFQPVVRCYGMTGAAVFYTCLMAALAIFFALLCFLSIIHSQL